MTISKFVLPEGLEVEDFWNLPVGDWRNITKYDFRFVFAHQELSKRNAHLAYSKDIKKLRKVVKPNSNRSQALDICEVSLEKAGSNHGNKYFWKVEAQKLVEIITRRMINKEEMANLEQETIMAALRSHNSQDVEGSKIITNSSSSSNGDGSSSGSSSDLSNLTEKRQATEDEEKTTSKKRRNITLEDIFHSYRREAAEKAGTKDGVCLETNIHEILALQDILLLKEFEHSDLIRSHFTDELLNRLYKDLTSGLYDHDNGFGKDKVIAVGELLLTYKKKVKHVSETRGAKNGCIRGLIAMMDDNLEAESSILFGLAALLQKLPLQTMLGRTASGETELWSSVFDPILSSILSDPEKKVMLRWSNVIPGDGNSREFLQVRPDALICEINQLSWGRSIGFGEVKLAEPTPNLDLLGQDIIRLAILGKKALADSKLNAVIMFQIHGYHMSVYISKLIPDTAITAMVQVFEIQFPRSVQEVDGFATQDNLDTLVHLYDVFWSNCPYRDSSAASTLSTGFELSTIHRIRQSTTNRSRPNVLRY